MGLENLDPLFCFDSGEGDSFPLMLCFFFFKDFSFNSELKKKKRRRFSGFNGISNESNNGALN